MSVPAAHRTLPWPTRVGLASVAIAYTVLRSTDVYGGGTLTAGGVADPSRDLAFKVVMQ